MPGVYLEESMTIGINGDCMMSVVNSLEVDVKIETAEIVLEEIDSDECENSVMLFWIQLVDDNNRLKLEQIT
jgi:hypothetical protein